MGGSSSRKDYKTGYKTLKNKGHVSYHGECDKNSKRHGMGASIFYHKGSKETYYGSHIDNSQTGSGEKRYGAKHIVRGQFFEGRPQGYSQLVIDNKKTGVYTGFMSAGKYQGLGLFKYGSGDFYYGYMKNSMQDGFGILVAGNQSYMYVGNFLGGHFQNQGYYIHILPDYIFEYTGEFKVNQMAGRGCMRRTFHTLSNRLVIEQYGNFKQHTAEEIIPQALNFDKCQNYARIKEADNMPSIYYRIKPNEEAKKESDEDPFPYIKEVVPENEIGYVHDYIKKNIANVVNNDVMKYIKLQGEVTFSDLNGAKVTEGPVRSGNNLLFKIDSVEAGQRKFNFVKCTLTYTIQDMRLATFERLIMDRLSESLYSKNQDLKDQMKPDIPIFFPCFATSVPTGRRHMVYNHDDALAPQKSIKNAGRQSIRQRGDIYRHEPVPLENFDQYEKNLNNIMNKYCSFFEYLEPAYFLANLMQNMYLDMYTLCVIFEKTMKAYQNLEEIGIYHNHVNENHIYVTGMEKNDITRIGIKIISFSRVCYFEENRPGEVLKDRISALRSGELDENLKNFKCSMAMSAIKPQRWNSNLNSELQSSTKARHDYLVRTKKPIDIWNYPDGNTCTYLRPQERWVVKKYSHTKQIQTWTSVSQRDIYSLAVVFMKAICLQGNNIIRNSHALQFDLLEQFNNILKIYIPYTIKQTDSTPESVQKMWLEKLSELRVTIINVFLRDNPDKNFYYHYVGYIYRIFEMLTSKFVAFSEIPPANMEIMLGKLQLVPDEKLLITLEEEIMRDRDIRLIDSDKYSLELMQISKIFLNKYGTYLIDPEYPERQTLCYGMQKVRRYEKGQNFDLINQYCSPQIQYLLNNTLPFKTQFFEAAELQSGFVKVEYSKLGGIVEDIPPQFADDGYSGNGQYEIHNREGSYGQYDEPIINASQPTVLVGGASAVNRFGDNNRSLREEQNNRSIREEGNNRSNEEPPSTIGIGLGKLDAEDDDKKNLETPTDQKNPKELESAENSNSNSNSDSKSPRTSPIEEYVAKVTATTPRKEEEKHGHIPPNTITDEKTATSKKKKQPFMRGPTLAPPDNNQGYNVGIESKQTNRVTSFEEASPMLIPLAGPMDEDLLDPPMSTARMGEVGEVGEVDNENNQIVLLPHPTLKPGIDPQGSVPQTQPELNDYERMGTGDIYSYEDASESEGEL